MQNTHAEVVIPRDLARQLKALLMALEKVWYDKGDSESLETVRRLASALINAEKLYSSPATEEEIEEAKKLVPSR